MCSTSHNNTPHRFLRYAAITVLGVLSGCADRQLEPSSHPLQPNGIDGTSTTKCRLQEADDCFRELFDNMPICSAAELTFRCQHFNVLDQCFRRSNIMCLPSAVGSTAKAAYKRKLGECAREAQKKYRHAPHHQYQQQHKQNRIRNGGWSARAGNRYLSAPNELQFISLFGYLQSQCRRKPHSDGGPPGEMTAVMPPPSASHAASSDLTSTPEKNPQQRNSGHSEGEGVGERAVPRRKNCNARELKELIGGCEKEMKLKSPSAKVKVGSKHSYAVDLDRHQLLRVKLEASSRLLLYTATRRNDECLMIRSVLSDIYQLHQKYCIQTTVTRCLCERLNLEHFCDIACSHLEPQGLPFEKALMWSDFRGRLTGQTKAGAAEDDVYSSSGASVVPSGVGAMSSLLLLPLMTAILLLRCL